MRESEPFDAVMLARVSDGVEVPCVFTRTGPFDALGRCEFSLDWVRENGDRRGQFFFAVPENHVRFLEEVTQ